MHCRNCGAEIQKGSAKCGNCDEPIFIYTPSDAVKQRMENRKKTQPQPMKWKIEISLGMALVITILTFIQCVLEFCSISIGGFATMLLLGVVLGSPVIVAFYLIMQFVLSYFLCYSFLSNVSHLGGFCTKNALKAFMLYFFLLYLYLIFLFPWPFTFLWGNQPLM
jgi:hypothetical protein